MWIQRAIRHSLRQQRELRVSWLALWWVCALAAAAWVPGCRRSSTSAFAPDAGPPLSDSERGAAEPLPLATLQGTVHVDGNVPSLPALKTSVAVERRCGKEIRDHTLVVNEEGALANVVVFLADVGSSSSELEGSRWVVSLDQRGCAYSPPVIAARAGAALEISNSDPLMHNVRASGQSPLFNFAMPVQGLKIIKRLPQRPAIIRVGCDVHPWMHAVIRTFDHPYFTVTDANGRYQVSVPSGPKKIVFWHERFPEQSVTVDIPGQIAVQNVRWPASELRF